MPIGPPTEFDDTPLPAFEFGRIVDVLNVFRFTQHVTVAVVLHVPFCVTGSVDVPRASFAGPR
jgi:hypothetical protein